MARVAIDVILTRDEVNAQIPYALICMTRYGQSWNTGRRRRRWLEEFTEAERISASRLFSMSHTWTLIKGVPEEVRMSAHTLALWLKLGEFCATI